MTDTRVLGISLRGWFRLTQWTVFGTLGCVAIAVGFNYLYFKAVAPEAIHPGLVSATIIPILLAGPLFFYLTLKLRELAIANHKMRIVASTDSLTACLNRGAFTNIVDTHLGTLPAGDGLRQGALLVIDADRFKSINDRFGHHCGDDALRMIANGIRLVLRKKDVFGRLGGEEFGVFLPEATPAEAAMVAERIRNAVSCANFQVDGRRRNLSVSIGGACFDGQVSFGELFRTADERLYAAKNTGRDKVEMACPAPNVLAPTPLTVH